MMNNYTSGNVFSPGIPPPFPAHNHHPQQPRNVPWCYVPPMLPLCSFISFMGGKSINYQREILWVQDSTFPSRQEPHGTAPHRHPNPRHQPPRRPCFPTGPSFLATLTWRNQWLKYFSPAGWLISPPPRRHVWAAKSRFRSRFLSRGTKRKIVALLMTYLFPFSLR